MERLKYLIVIISFLVGILCGIFIEWNNLASGLWSNLYQIYIFRSDLAGRQEKKLSELSSHDDLMVAIVFGQSNSANYGESRHKSVPGVYNFHRGKLYLAEDPLLGAQGGRGSVWTRLGDMLVGNGIYDSVVFVSLGMGATPISRWTDGGDLHKRILQAAKQLSDVNLRPTHLLWHQGESDASLGTPPEDYQAMFRKMIQSIRSKEIDAPIYISIATRCKSLRGDSGLQQAQRELVAPSAGILAGPDTDQLGFAYRYDGCHFTDEGLQRHAELWYEKLVP